MTSLYTINSGSGSASPAIAIRTGGKEVIASGTVMTADSRSLELQFSHMRIVFAFHNESAEMRMDAVADPAGSTLTLNLHSFNNTLGTGTNAPLEVGTLQGRTLWLCFMVYASSPTSIKTVHYTFLLG